MLCLKQFTYISQKDSDAVEILKQRHALSYADSAHIHAGAIRKEGPKLKDMQD